MGGGLLRRIRPALSYLVATVVVGLLVAVVTVAQMAFLSEVADWVFLKGGGREQTFTLVLLLLGAAVLRAGLLWVRETTAQRGAVRVKNELRERLFAHVLRLGPAYARSERSGELTTTLTEGIERLDPYFARYLPQVLLSVFVPLLVVGYILPRDIASALLLVVTAPVIPVMMVLVGSYAEEHTRRQWLALSRMGAHFLDALQGLPTLKAFGRVAAEEEKVERVSGEFRERTLKVLRYAFLSGLVLEFMTAAAIALVAVVLGVRLINGAISFQDAFLVLLLTPEFYRPLRELGTHRHAGMEGKVAAARIFEILDTPVPEDGRSQESPSGELEISFSGVSFTYPGRELPALDGLTLTLLAGSRTAVVGRSGSGKSTLVGLLLRFMDPDAGIISANGVPVGDLPAGAWREHVALVPQRPHLFYGSVLENIRLARPDASRAAVERAAELAGAAEFIRRMPHGYDTQIGETFVMGVVTGIPLEFQFGTNWAAFSEYAGDIIAQTLAMEGAFAFFLESAFVGLFLWGEDRFGQRVHWFSSLMVFLGTWASGYFIITTNAWVQHPVGYRVLENGNIELDNYWAVLLNSWMWPQYAHNMGGAVVCGAFVMAGLGAFYVLGRRHEEYGRIFLKVGVTAGVLASLWMLFPSGHFSSEQVAEHQPVSLAAMEGLFESERQAGIVLIGQPDVENRRIDNPIVVPRALSYLVYQNWNAEVRGLDAFPEKNWPDNIPLLYYSYHVMVGLGTIFIAIMVVAAFLLWRSRLYGSRWMLWILMLAIPFPFIANTAGWFTAELGRQPWLAYGLFRTSEGVSPLVSSGSVLFTLVGFAGMYLIMGLLYIVLMVREVGHGPEGGGDALESPETLTA